MAGLPINWIYLGMRGNLSWNLWDTRENTNYLQPIFAENIYQSFWEIQNFVLAKLINITIYWWVIIHSLTRIHGSFIISKYFLFIELDHYVEDRIQFSFHWNLFCILHCTYIRIFILIFKYIYFKRLRMAGFMLLKLIEKESY